MTMLSGFCSSPGRAHRVGVAAMRAPSKNEARILLVGKAEFKPWAGPALEFRSGRANFPSTSNPA
jgi:hypothetical protein